MMKKVAVCHTDGFLKGRDEILNVQFCTTGKVYPLIEEYGDGSFRIIDDQGNRHAFAPDGSQWFTLEDRPEGENEHE